jgi:hypothetical protein
MTDSPVEDFFALEPLLLARLTETFPGVSVQAGNDLNDLRARRTLEPGIFITYQSYALEDQQAQFGQSRLRQTWLVIVAQQCLWYSQSNVGARPDTGSLIARVLKSLLGWKPNPHFSKLALASPPAWELTDYNVAYPIAVSTLFTLLGDT